MVGLVNKQMNDSFTETNRYLPVYIGEPYPGRCCNLVAHFAMECYNTTIL